MAKAIRTGKNNMKSIKGRIAVALVALICLFAGMANGEREAWDCPECGRKGNTGNFCGSCRHPAPEDNAGESTESDSTDAASTFVENPTAAPREMKSNEYYSNGKSLKIIRVSASTEPLLSTPP